MNDTSFGLRDAVYILGQRPGDVPDDEFFLCSLIFGYTTSCSTRYNASSSGQSLEAICDDMSDSDSPEPEFESHISSSYLASRVIQVMGLDSDAQSIFESTSWSFNPVSTIFTYLQLARPLLEDSLPSPAEALLSMATCTVLDLSRDFQFVPIPASIYISPRHAVLLLTSLVGL